MIKNYALRADLTMLLVAIIWGSTFVVQRLGMNHVGPFTYTGLRFAAAVLVLIPFLVWHKSKISSQLQTPKLWQGGLWMGLVMCGAINLQQIGLLFTSVTNAGFITGLYVVIVPILGLFLGIKTSLGTWIGAILATIGMTLLSITANFTVAFGDLLQLTGAVLWASHVLLITNYAKKFDALLLACIQFIVCSVISCILALIFEKINLNNIKLAIPTLLYGGILAAGIGYTLQIIAQRNAIASHAAIILSTEALFAALAGVIFLHEFLSMRTIIGCVFMLSGMLFAQLWCNKT